MDRRTFERRPRIEGIGVVAIVILIIVAGVVIFSVGQVGVGYVAVVVDPLSGSTSTQGDGSNARYFFKPPWASIVRVYVATDSVNMWTEGAQEGDFPAVPSLTKDGLRVDVDITVRWSVSPESDRVVNLFRRFPSLDWKDRTIIPIIRSTIRDIIVNFTAIETIAQRSAVNLRMETALNSALNRETTLVGAINLQGVDLRRIALPQNFIEAIESKLAAEQLAIAAEFNKTKILILANATAISQIIQAEGSAKSKIIIANGTRAAIDIIAAQRPDLNSTQLTNLYLYLETLRAIAETGKSQFIIIPSDSGRFILQLPSG